MNLSIDTLFTAARSHNCFDPAPISESTLRALYDLMKWGPTAANSCPARLVFVQSPEEKEKLLACMSAGNTEKTRSAPVTAILGMDMAFYEQLPVLFPHTDAKSWFAGKPEHIATTALRNASLQGGYFILAARALGLDCGPMSGFDAARLDEAFFAGTTIKTNFVCALGRGQPEALHSRGPRLSFEQACRIA